jgi:hypothetical protein
MNNGEGGGMLTEKGKAYAVANAATSMVAKVALFGRGEWPDSHVDAAIEAVNKKANES